MARIHESIIACGAKHNLLVGKNGSVWSWGRGTFGVLGGGVTTAQTNPVMVLGSSHHAIAVAAGLDHSLAILHEAGTIIKTWGRNNEGQLGNGGNMSALFAVQAKYLKDCVAIAGGALHSLAVYKGDIAAAWGNNSTGELGSGTVSLEPRRTRVNVTMPQGVISSARRRPSEALSPVRDVAAGDGFSLALMQDGRVLGWGYNMLGVLGTGDATLAATTPFPTGVPLREKCIAIATKTNFVLALDEAGHVWGWGSNDRGQLGAGTGQLVEVPPVLINLRNIKFIAAGDGSSYAIDNNGDLWSWGSNGAGQLGQGYIDAEAHPKPAKVRGLPPVKAVAAGTNHVVVVAEDDSVWAWGSNSSGEIGDGTTNLRASPVRVVNGDFSPFYR